MKNFILGATLLATGLFGTANAQIQKGNIMVGGDIAGMRFTNGVNVKLNPKIGYFVQDNWAVGANVGLDVSSPQNTNATQTNYTVGAFTRYYFGPNEIDGLLKHGRFFTEGSVGVGGSNSSVGNSTNGVDLGIGAGYAYFITPNVSVEGLLKYNAVAGGGNTASNGNLNLGVGFQIYLPTSKAKQIINREK